MSMFKDIVGDLDEPLEFSYKLNIFKANKMRILIISEDMSGAEFFVKFPASYTIEVSKRYYFVVPKAIIRVGKWPTMVFYYNNPWPVEFVFTKSIMTAWDLRDPVERGKIGEEDKTMLSGVIMDSEMVKLGFDSRVIGNIYGRGIWTAKTFLIIGGAILVTILVFLQLFGVVDVFGLLTGGAKK